jgi:ubiquinone/menaquinone biosynthesis C-methylase UbiE
MKYFHEILSDQFGAIARFNHSYALRSASSDIRTLEIGAGLGSHLEFEDLSAQRYIALELREEMADVLRQKHPDVETAIGDAQESLPLDDDSIDRVIAIHVLEHLTNLPVALEEIRRVLRPGGRISVVIPCEGGFVYGLGRRFTSQRIFEKRYRTSYDWYIKTEHFNVPAEIIGELDKQFEAEHRRWWPLRVPSVHLNVCIGLTYVLRDGSA